MRNDRFEMNHPLYMAGVQALDTSSRAQDHQAAITTQMIDEYLFSMHCKVTKSIGDGPYNFEPWSSDEDDA
ncbi:hypothetical protein TNCV_1629781 [Trichonephila clavipes]|uniref:Uncharacterized protein n=1 Tax=Trichonephila clavipes TaxID=2585209 RepID=A0A8X6VWJ4_TRICX|nr:hypothetical protein TNCV_1629781 [Trichonephila clavipes]